MNTLEIGNTNCIQTSEETMTLIRRRAMLSDIHNTVNKIMNGNEKLDYSDYINEFEDDFDNMDAVLSQILWMRMDVELTENNFTRI